MSRSKELILLAQRIRALSQTGLVYSLSEYDTERYEELSRLSDEITALATGLKPDDVEWLPPGPRVCNPESRYPCGCL